MVGGIVLETIVLPDRVWVNCGELKRKTECAIYVERTPDSEQIRIADKLWWQGGYAMWTPLDMRFKEKRLKRIGFSGVSRPEV